MTSLDFIKKLDLEFSPRNHGVAFDSLSLYSRKKFWWQCFQGHEWEAAVKSRYERLSSCPFCVGKKAWPGFNDLAFLHPALAKEWHPTKNDALTPEQVTAGSSQKVWWQCEKGHEWEASVKNRYKLNHGCPVCVNRKIVPGVNDLATTHPELAAQWHPTRNIVSAAEVSSGSVKKVWWQCEKSHEWEATVVSRAVHHASCLICMNKSVLVGVNDPGFVTPGLTAQFHTTKNGSVLLSDFTHGSEAKVWWQCEKGHEWEARINGRKRYGCPVCGQRVSVKEDDLFQYVSGLVSCEVVKNGRSLLKKYELDVYIPEKNIAIEFNGLYWHSERFKSKTYHYDKWVACKEQGVQLIQVWEDDWDRNPELVKRMLAYKLGVSSFDRVYARSCVVKEISQPVVSAFLHENHIQGSVAGGVRAGLFFNEKLIAVAVFRREADGVFNLLRYATSVSAVGGFTKLLTFVEKVHHVQGFITFSDHTVSDGGLYASSGFIADKELSPDYMYIVHGVRKHKFGYRLKRFFNDPELKYVEGFTESQLAALNNIPRIWDAGKTRWVKTCV